MATTVKAFCAPVRAARVVRSVKARASDRSLWYPGMTAPSHLDGSMAGDFGFDPLGLGTQGSDRLKWCVVTQLTCGRSIDKICISLMEI
jgi:hypothetical protein